MFYCLKHFLTVLLLVGCLRAAIPPDLASVIRSGIPWYDQHGKIVSARGAGITREGELYYLFGEFKRDGGNAFAGFSCYSSADLENWRFERMVLPVQADGPAGPGRVGERPKVLKCPSTGEYVLFFHSDDARYKDQAVAYATSPTIDGEYTFCGPLLFEGKPIRKWDMSVFQDDDGSGYLVTHSGNLYRLASDYKSVVAQVVSGMTAHCEAPAIFKREGLYYWIGSGLTAWERNDNEYFTATALAGPWIKRGIIAPKDTLTWNSQTTFVLPVTGSEATTYLFMGDRWAHPYQNSAATYVWQPLVFSSDGALALPTYHPSWELNTRTGRWSSVNFVSAAKVIELKDLGARLVHTADWEAHAHASGCIELRSAVKGAELTVAFTGTRIGFYGVARDDGGFGRVELKNTKGELVLSTIIETYCLYEDASPKFLSPRLARGDYTLTITPLGERFFWQAKTRAYGSRGDFVSVQKVIQSD